jgi:hypothetical protein
VALAADNLEVNGNPVVPPLEHHDDDVQTKNVGSIFIPPPFLGQRMLLISFVFERAIHHQITP